MFLRHAVAGDSVAASRLAWPLRGLLLCRCRYAGGGGGWAGGMVAISLIRFHAIAWRRLESVAIVNAKTLAPIRQLGSLGGLCFWVAVPVRISRGVASGNSRLLDLIGSKSIARLSVTAAPVAVIGAAVADGLLLRARMRAISCQIPKAEDSPSGLGGFRITDPPVLSL